MRHNPERRGIVIHTQFLSGVRRHTLSFGWKFFRTLLLIGLCFVLVYPLIYMVSMAFRPLDQIYDPAIIWVPKSFTLDNLMEAYEVMDYPSALATTFSVNVVSACLQVVMASFVGYGFARFDFRFKKILFTVVIITILVPYQIILNPLYLDFKSFDFMGILKLVSLAVGKDVTLNLLNTPLTFYLPALFCVGLKGGLIIFLFRQFYKGMPKELEDAAAIDGCGFLSSYLRIILPNAVPIIVTALVLSGVWYWNDSFIGSTLMANHRTVMVALTNLQSELIASVTMASGTDPYQLVVKMQAGCILAIAPVLLIYLIVQRQFVQSVQRSGIVG